MEYRKLPHGDELISVLGLGTGSLVEASEEEIEQVIRLAITSGINFFDLCAGNKKVFRAFGKAIKNQREKVYIQVHFGAVYNEKDEYAWSRDLATIKNTFAYILKELDTDYVDFGFLHCVDELDDFEELKRNGVFDYLKDLKSQGVVHHIGLSSHTPSVANAVIDTGLIDMMMFSINPAYDYEYGDELGIGSVKERKDLFVRSESLGIGISVMKPFFGGKLLDEKQSPFKVKLTKNQCLQYALDRPAVLTCVPGVRNLKDLKELLSFIDTSPKENDYAIIGTFKINKLENNCVYCNHCQPCPMGIDIGIVNKYYDLATIGDDLAKSHYHKLKLNATSCVQCGHCNSQCPFNVKQMQRMLEIADYFSKN
ncbi:MAG: aldo/keto reductase [Erysipelotrichales bacterium]|nr:aldo/keto reductase [Erysipelotrichales bacterium]